MPSGLLPSPAWFSDRFSCRRSRLDGTLPLRSRAVAIVKIPPVLRASTGGQKEIAADGENVGEVLRAVAELHAETERQIFSEDGELNRYVNVYLNDEDVRVLQGLETPVRAEDTLVLLPAMAGG